MKKEITVSIKKSYFHLNSLYGQNVHRCFMLIAINTNGNTPVVISPNNLGKTALTGHTKYVA